MGSQPDIPAILQLRADQRGARARGARGRQRRHRRHPPNRPGVLQLASKRRRSRWHATQGRRRRAFQNRHGSHRPREQPYLLRALLPHIPVHSPRSRRRERCAHSGHAKAMLRCASEDALLLYKRGDEHEYASWVHVAGQTSFTTVRSQNLPGHAAPSPDAGTACDGARAAGIRIELRRHGSPRHPRRGHPTRRGSSRGQQLAATRGRPRASTAADNRAGPHRLRVGARLRWHHPRPNGSRPAPTQQRIAPPTAARFQPYLATRDYHVSNRHSGIILVGGCLNTQVTNTMRNPYIPALRDYGRYTTFDPYMYQVLSRSLRLGRHPYEL